MKECCGNPLRGCAECPPKKLTFEEWWEENKSTNFWSEEDLAQSVWQAAQENMPDTTKKKIPAILRKGEE